MHRARAAACQCGEAFAGRLNDGLRRCGFKRAQRIASIGILSRRKPLLRGIALFRGV